MGIVVLVLAVPALLPAVAMLVGGVHLLRRPTPVARVPVEAVVVHVENFRRPARVTFDYPAPDGSWLRARRTAGLLAVQRDGWGVAPGDRLTVWVHPARPADVSLGEVGSAGGFLGVALVVVGVGWGLAGLAVLVSFVASSG